MRVKHFEGYIKDEMKKSNLCREDREITRKPGNPMVRRTGALTEEENKSPQLRLI
jgi:hypothetical protein